MNKFVLIFCLVNCFLCDGQEQTSKGDSINEADIYRHDRIRSLASLYSDSIMSWSDTTEIPSFVLNPTFDSKYSFLWKSQLYPISLRYEILQKITNTDVLLAILNTKNRGLDKKNKYDYFDIPFRRYTWKDLILLRIAEIKHYQFKGKGLQTVLN